MPFQVLRLHAGVDVEQTPLLNEAGWSFANLIRFFNRLAQKLGGWAHLNNMPLVGSVRELHSWADLSGIAYMACGSEQRLAIFSNGVVTDITPIRQTVDITPAFSTVINTPTVTVQQAGHLAAVNDGVNIVVPIAVGGIVIQGIYAIQTVVDSSHYTITAASNATATVTNAGTVPSFTTIMSSANVSVTLANHGLITGQSFQVQVTTVVGGLTLTAGSIYSVSSVTNANVFVIVPNGPASSGATVSENSGNARIENLLGAGLASTALSGYGQGVYGSGPYGQSSGIPTRLRQWFLDNWGEQMIGNYNGSPIYVWVPPVAFGNVAIPIDGSNFPSSQDPPTIVNFSFVSAPQQILIAGGCNPVGLSTQDALLVRWCDTGDYTDWLAASGNFAGSYRIPSGSRLVGGTHMALFNLLWTDIDMWVMSFIGGSLVYGFTQVASGCGLIGPKAIATYKNLVFWVSPNNFFAFDGNSVSVIPCPVWDVMWYNLNSGQGDKIFCATNSEFGEVAIFYPSATGNAEVDSYIKYNVADGAWDYGTLIRLAWEDVNVFGSPIGTDAAGLLQQHEVGNDADGAPMASTIRSGWFAIAEGTAFSFVERMMADFVVTGGDLTVMVTVYTQDYPIGPVTTYGPFSWTPAAGPPLFIVRARGRFMSIEVSSQGLGSFWRVGGIHYLLAPAGRR